MINFKLKTVEEKGEPLLVVDFIKKIILSKPKGQAFTLPEMNVIHSINDVFDLAEEDSQIILPKNDLQYIYQRLSSTPFPSFNEELRVLFNQIEDQIKESE
jgi:Ca2+-binding EF-hand superfamily protein